MMLRSTLTFMTLFSFGEVFAQQANTNVVPKAIFGGSVRRAFYSPALPPVGRNKTTFVVYEPVTVESPVYVSPVPKVEAPQSKPDAPAAAATPKRPDEQEAKR